MGLVSKAHIIPFSSSCDLVSSLALTKGDVSFGHPQFLVSPLLELGDVANMTIHIACHITWKAYLLWQDISLLMLLLIDRWLEWHD